MLIAANTLSGFCKGLFKNSLCRARLLPGLLLCVAGIGWANMPVLGAPGDMDITFSQDGKLFDFFVRDGWNEGYGSAIQPDGKFVVTGESSFGRIQSCAITRYNTDGTPDPTFDGDSSFNIPTGRQIRCQAVAVQPDGKIVAVGYIEGPGLNVDFITIRLNTDGSADTSFDADGIVTTTFASTEDADRAYSVAIQPDGKIVVAGSTFDGNWWLKRSTAGVTVMQFGQNGDRPTENAFGN